MERSHRLFLQCFMAKPFMSEEDAKDSYSKCIEVFQVLQRKNHSIVSFKSFNCIIFDMPFKSSHRGTNIFLILIADYWSNCVSAKIV